MKPRYYKGEEVSWQVKEHTYYGFIAEIIPAGTGFGYEIWTGEEFVTLPESVLSNNVGCLC
jgi:hypothetical protein